MTEERQEEGSLSEEDVVRRRHLVNMWIKNEEEIERLSNAIKRCKVIWIRQKKNGSTQQPLSFWEKAKLDGAGDQEHSADGESSGSGSTGFSFGFDFGGEEPDKDIEAEVEVEIEVEAEAEAEAEP